MGLIRQFYIFILILFSLIYKFIYFTLSHYFVRKVSFLLFVYYYFFLMTWIQKFDIQHHIVDFSLTWNKIFFQEDHEYISYSNFKNILLGNCPFSYVVLHFPKSQHLFSLSLNLLLWFRDNLDCPSLFPVPMSSLPYKLPYTHHTPTLHLFISSLPQLQPSDVPSAQQ